MIDFGTVRPGTTLYVPFSTYDSNDPTASVTMTGLAVTDIEIYKDGGTTQRGSDAGYALLDTDGIDFDSITGIHGFSINLADNTTAGFYAAGSQYWVVVSSITVDAGTINFIAATFRIGIPDAVLNTTIATLASQTSFTLTAGPAENDALNGCVVYIHDVASAVQGGWAVVSDYTGSSRTVTLTAGTTFTAAASDNIAIFSPVNTRWIGSTAQTARDIGANVLLSPGTGTGQISLTSGAVTAGTVSDKTGYSLTATTGLGNQTANITGNLSGSVGSVTGAVGSIGTAGISSGSFAAGAINAAAIADAAIDAATFAADVDAEILSYLVDDATRIDASALNTANVTSIPAILEDTGTTLPASLVAIEADTQDLQVQIGTDGAGLTAIPWNAAWDAEVNAEVVDVLRTDTLPDDYAAHEAQPTMAEAILAIHQFLFEREVSGTSVTVQKPDGATTAMTLTLNDGTNPTSVHRSA